MIAVTLAAELLLMNAIGACLRWKGMVNKEFSSRLTNLILNICVPCLIFQSINNAAEFSAEALKNCMVVLVLGVVAVAVPLLAGHLIYLATGKSGRRQPVEKGEGCHSEPPVSGRGGEPDFLDWRLEAPHRHRLLREESAVHLLAAGAAAVRHGDRGA